MAIASEEPEVGFVEPIAPPPPPAEESNPKALPGPSPRTAVWTIGYPTGEEQLYLELINRARDNPTNEGIRLAALTDPAILQAYDQYGVNLDMMKSEMAGIPRAWPLAMNAKLLASARGHSSWMLNSGLQEHDQPGGKTIQQRALDQGYVPTFIAENIYNASKSTEFGHAGFEVDWGPGGTDGMQLERAHRAIMHGAYREVGIGIVDGTNGAGGPQLVTQDFAVPAGLPTPFLTGVAYYDFNGNNFYDPDEGLGGLTVTVEGASYHGLTAGSGGYALPVPATPSGATPITRAVTFSGNGFLRTTYAQIKSIWSVKVDYVPLYTPPALIGPAMPVISFPNIYVLTPVPGASSHQWRYMRRIPAATDGANDTSRITSSLSPVLSSVKQEGSSSYRLHHLNGQDEYVVYSAPRVAGSAPGLRYYSRLAAALTTDRALVQASTDNGHTWLTLETQSGTGDSGQGSFSQRTVSLSAVAGRDFLLRFYYAITGTSFAIGSGAGWFIDSVSFTDVLETEGAVSSSVAGNNTITFAPPATGEWLLAARSVINGRTLAFGPNLTVSAVAPPPLLAFSTWASEQETAAGVPAGTISENGAADYNKDGVANLVAYALGLSATQYEGHHLPQPVRQGGNLVLDYAREGSRSGVTVAPEISSDLHTWYSLGQADAPAGFNDTLASTTGTRQSRRAQLPIDPSKPWSLRLRVTRP